MTNAYGKFIQFNDNKLYCCRSCSKTFSTLKNIQKHVRKVHVKLPQVESKKCDHCDKSFLSDLKLNDHMKNVSKKYFFGFMILWH